MDETPGRIQNAANRIKSVFDKMQTTQRSYSNHPFGEKKKNYLEIPKNILPNIKWLKPCNNITIFSIINRNVFILKNKEKHK